MKTAFLIHGSYGNPDENWFPWLKSELEKQGYEVIAPKFPTPENQSLENWMKVFQEHKKLLDENTILIGHSLGPAFILSILGQFENPVRAAYFVAPFISLLNNPEFDEVNKTFMNKSFDWEKIKNNCHQFHIFHSDNDPYVPLEKAEEIAKNLDINVNIIKNAGHFNKSAGYKEFPELLNCITSSLK